MSHQLSCAHDHPCCIWRRRSRSHQVSPDTTRGNGPAGVAHQYLEQVINIAVRKGSYTHGKCAVERQPKRPALLPTSDAASSVTTIASIATNSTRSSHIHVFQNKGLAAGRPSISKQRFYLSMSTHLAALAVHRTLPDQD